MGVLSKAGFKGREICSRGKPQMKDGRLLRTAMGSLNQGGLVIAINRNLGGL